MLCPRLKATFTLSVRLYTVASMRQRIQWLAVLITSVTLTMRLLKQIIKQMIMKKRKKETRKKWKRKNADAHDADKNQTRKRKLPRYSKLKNRRKTLLKHKNNQRKIRAT